MRWKDVKLGGKFTISYGLIIVLLIVVAIWSIKGIYGLVVNAEEVIDGNEIRSHIEKTHVQHLKWTLDLNKYITDETVTELNVQIDPHQCAFGKWYYGEGRKHVEGIAPELKPIFEAMEEPHLHLHESASEIEEIVKNSDNAQFAMDNALVVYNTRTQTYLNQIGNLFKQTVDKSKEVLITDEVMLTNAQSARYGIIVLSIGAIIVAIIFAVVIAIGIIRPLRKSVGFAGEVANGDLTAKVSIDQKDEIGKLAAALKYMQQKLTAIIGEVQEGSEYIASASQVLSSNASEQAASTEEVSSSMEEMIANIEQNSDNATQTESIANKAAKEIAIGYQSVNQTVSSMQEIAEKITIIEEIAEKTDLLAINAAIEAARAGDHGKGFAVVAMEVRKLAERSQQAASQINSVSKTSVSVAEETGKKMSEIVPEIEKTSTLVQEISAASREQNAGAGQVNSALQQLNQSNQTTAANSEELASQAEQLKDTISFFKLAQNGSGIQQKAVNVSETLPEVKEQSSEMTTIYEQTSPSPQTSNDEFEKF